MVRRPVDKFASTPTSTTTSGFQHRFKELYTKPKYCLFLCLMFRIIIVFDFVNAEVPLLNISNCFKLFLVCKIFFVTKIRSFIKPNTIYIREISCLKTLILKDKDQIWKLLYQVMPAWNDIANKPISKPNQKEEIQPRQKRHKILQITS